MPYTRKEYMRKKRSGTNSSDSFYLKHHSTANPVKNQPSIVMTRAATAQSTVQRCDTNDQKEAGRSTGHTWMNKCAADGQENRRSKTHMDIRTGILTDVQSHSCHAADELLLIQKSKQLVLDSKYHFFLYLSYRLREKESRMGKVGKTVEEEEEREKDAYCSLIP